MIEAFNWGAWLAMWLAPFLLGIVVVFFIYWQITLLLIWAWNLFAMWITIKWERFIDWVLLKDSEELLHNNKKE